MQQAISTTYKYTSKILYKIGDYSMISDSILSCDNLQQDGISEAVGFIDGLFIPRLAKGASCPYCGHFSHRLHSYYSRHIQDLEVYSRRIGEQS